MLFLHFNYALDLTDITMGDNSDAPKKKAKENAAIMAAAFSWSTGGYDLFILLMFIPVLAVVAIYIDVYAVYISMGLHG